MSKETIYVTALNLKSIRGMKDVTLRAFKYVDNDYSSPMYISKKDKRKLKYTPGTTVEVPLTECNTVDNDDCGAGVNVATRSWVEGNMYHLTHKILVVEFSPKDIVAIPTRSGGKFRLSRCKVISETGCSYKSKGNKPW